MGYFSNGTEGEAFEERWCNNCIHSDTSDGREIGVDAPCPVWMAHTLFAYDLCNSKGEGKQILDMLITHKIVKASDGFGLPVNECAMFAPVDGASPGQTRMDV